MTQASLAKLDPDDNKIIISRELFTNARYVDRAVIGQHLREIFQPKGVILTIRNQYSAIQSQYRHAIRKEKIDNSSFFDFIDSSLWFPDSGPALADWRFQQYRYGSLVSAYEKIFGARNVQILFYEDFVEKNADIVCDFSSFLGLDAEMMRDIFLTSADKVWNASSQVIVKPDQTIKSIVGERQARRLGLAQKIKRAVKMRKKQPELESLWLTNDYKELLWKYYASDNGRLSEGVQNKMRKFGYPLPEDRIK
jgi:hypothetical protein